MERVKYYRALTADRRSSRRQPGSKLVIILNICLALCLPVSAQRWETVKFTESPTVIEPVVTYVSNAPVIDGVLDSCLQNLPIRHFTVVEKSAADNSDFTMSLSASVRRTVPLRLY